MPAEPGETPLVSSSSEVRLSKATGGGSRKKVAAIVGVTAVASVIAIAGVLLVRGTRTHTVAVAPSVDPPPATVAAAAAIAPSPPPSVSLTPPSEPAMSTTPADVAPTSTLPGHRAAPATTSRFAAMPAQAAKPAPVASSPPKPTDAPPPPATVAAPAKPVSSVEGRENPHGTVTRALAPARTTDPRVRHRRGHDPFDSFLPGRTSFARGPCRDRHHALSRELWRRPPRVSQRPRSGRPRARRARGPATRRGESRSGERSPRRAGLRLGIHAEPPAFGSVEGRTVGGSRSPLGQTQESR